MALLRDSGLGSTLGGSSMLPPRPGMAAQAGGFSDPTSVRETYDALFPYCY